MPKLSASSGILDTEEVPRTELTPETIKIMTDADLEAWLLKLRGNREVTSSKTKSGDGSPRTPKSTTPTKSDEEDIFGS
jgi:hypothetical protein